jgi:hypothetical protein
MADVRRRTAAETLELLDQFQQTHGRLPKSNATDAEEKHLANFMFATLRRREKRGTLKPAIRERAARIPGALALDTHPDQDGVLADLKVFVKEHGHAPRHTRNGVPPEEIRLRIWISNNVCADPGAKTPRLRARHEAILALLAGVPSYAEKDLDDRIAAAEQFIRDHGYRPSGRDMSWLNDYIYGTYSIEGPYGARSMLNDIRAGRLKAIIAAPNAGDYRWRRNFEELSRYAEARAGSLPTNWDEPLFSWLTKQRSQYRRGKLSPEREATLHTLPSVLPGSRELAAAA